ncbi:hypothetical protein EUX98_g3999 [Antrodiella citrinella]|uniref:Uncharacterized protein n=1 Tax=Antrodiella citrinella TaxID=2447956 RepID=A0A4S4MW48_9APHY|nr:hypothetical protein EUX98_g3999 [Antrodiella citrinella]
MLRNAISTTSSRVVLASTSTRSLGRSFHSTPLAAKTATDKVKEVVDKVNKTVGRGLAQAIEKGEKATEVTKDAVGTTTDKAKQSADVAGQKANQAAAGMREGKEDFKKEVRK